MYTGVAGYFNRIIIIGAPTNNFPSHTVRGTSSPISATLEHAVSFDDRKGGPGGGS